MGGGDFEKKSPASACQKKKIACSTNVIERSLWEKKGKKYPAHQIANKKIFLMTRNHRLPLSPSRVKWFPLSEERKIAQKVKFAHIAHD